MYIPIDNQVSIEVSPADTAEDQQAYLEELASIALDLQMEQYEDVMAEFEDDMIDEGEEIIQSPTMQQCLAEVSDWAARNQS